MKTLIDHINEALKIGKNISSFSAYSCQPANKDELKEIIKKRIKQDGPDCDLNDIDVSLITDMSFLFNESKFTGNISNWDTSNVNDMCGMFKGSNFNCDISKWDVSNVNDMTNMFRFSKFNQDISNWDVSGWKYTDVDDAINVFSDCNIKEKFKPIALQNLDV